MGRYDDLLRLPEVSHGVRLGSDIASTLEIVETAYGTIKVNTV